MPHYVKRYIICAGSDTVLKLSPITYTCLTFFFILYCIFISLP